MALARPQKDSGLGLQNLWCRSALAPKTIFILSATCTDLEPAMLQHYEAS
jgi:hypothetical protein